jgi:phosphatidylserine decarboxylase
MITRYGLDVFLLMTVLCVVSIGLSLFLIKAAIIKYSIVVLAFALFGFTVNFFRDPERITPSGETHIIAPADGTIIQIKEVKEREFMKDSATIISIFMSPLNVHVNRSPIDGTVDYTRYVKGEYFVASEDKASERNEQMIIGMAGKHGKVLFKQVAGFVARRIVCPLKPGDSLRAGERFGMIKFGSRVDVFIPTNAKVAVAVGSTTVAGETILADFKN